MARPPCPPRTTTLPDAAVRASGAAGPTSISPAALEELTNGRPRHSQVISGSGTAAIRQERVTF